MKFFQLAVVLLFVSTSSVCAATVIASQNFEGNSLAVGITANDQVGTIQGTVFDSAAGLGWSASYVDTGFNGPLFGLESNDLIGVVNAVSPTVINSSGTNVNNLIGASNITGNWFHVDDADGVILLTFDEVDASNFSNLTLEFDWTVSQTRPGCVCTLDLSINGLSFFNISGVDIDNDKPFVNNFTHVQLDVSLLDLSFLNIVVSFRNFVDPEDFGFDNLTLSGDFTGPTEVPLPASFWLFGSILAGITALRREQKIPEKSS